MSSYQVNFGTFAAASSAPVAKKSGSFRIAILGDFSASASSGRLETGAALAMRKPLRVDCDNLDAVLARLKIKLKLHIGSGVVELPIASMDDFHPDELYGKLGLFTELSGLRQRLKSSSTFAKAAQEVQSWAGQVDQPALRRPKNLSRGAAVPANGKLSDFARLVGVASDGAETQETPARDFIKRIVGPHIVPQADPKQGPMVATVDSALAATMRSVLHHPDFQTLESTWRSVDFLVRRLETDTNLQIVLYDVTAEELAADLSQPGGLEDSGLYKMLIEEPASDVHQGAFAAIVGNYQFERTPPHAELLGRMARIVSKAPAPFLTSISCDVLDQDVKELHPLIVDAWAALRAMPEASYLAVATPRFMLRLPYGDRTDPIDSFDFEEFSAANGIRSMLWGNPAVIAGLLLGLSFTKNGARLDLGSIMGVGDMPFYYFEDKDGDLIPLPCTERMLTSRLAAEIGRQGFMPLLSMKGSPQVRLASFDSLSGQALAGSWEPVTAFSSDAAGAKATQSATATPAPTPAQAAPEEAAAPESDAADAADADEAPASTPADDELSALLASLSQEPEPAAAPDGEASTEEPPMDPDLAALLGELGV